MSIIFIIYRVSFWEDSNNYRDKFDSLLEGERKTERDRIIELYLKEKSIHAISCPKILIDAVFERAEHDTVELTIFNDIISYIEGVVIKNQESGFLNSIFGTKASVLQKWYEIFDKFDYDIQMGIFEKVFLCLKEKNISNTNIDDETEKVIVMLDTDTNIDVKSKANLI